MKTTKSFPNRGIDTNAFHASTWHAVTALAVLAVLAACNGFNQTAWAAELSGYGDEQGVQTLTRGPVHEAFAGVVTFNPEPGVVAPMAPAADIEEVPPDQRPEGSNVDWIPGYWAWDDEWGDFIWVSGVWRVLPPGRQWMAGYWAETAQGYQWTSGYWADSAALETTYLPEPPATVEAGPNIAAPSPDYGWAPGSWVWNEDRYAWRPGFWLEHRSDWDWVPGYYVWTPRGCVFVDGYWDYGVERRGILFAPVYFDPQVYERRDYRYSPSIVINLAAFLEHLFLRPSYHHYYFGDYYAPSYSSRGFYASYSYGSGGHGYDPIWTQQRWEHRQDRNWERNVETAYHYRRDHEDARPPRTWVAQTNINVNVNTDNSRLVATSFDQLSRRKDNPVRLQRVAEGEKQQLAQREHDVRKSREERRTVEAGAAETPTTKPGRRSEPTAVKLSRSPIASKPADQLGKDQFPPRPHNTPRPDSKVRTTREDQPQAEQPFKREVRPGSDRPMKREAQPQMERPAAREVQPQTQNPSRHEAQPQSQQPSKRETQPQSKKPAKHEAQPQTQQPFKHEVQPQSQQPSRREAPSKSKKPSKHEALPQSQQPPRREAQPQSQKPPRHEAQPQSQQPSRHEAQPQTQKPPRHEAQPQSQKPPRREAQPQSQQPPRHEAPPQSKKPAKSDAGPNRKSQDSKPDKESEKKRR